MKNIERLFNVIDNSLFMTTGKLDYDRITDAILVLCKEISNYEGETEFMWSIGEYGLCDLGDLIVGAYWHYTEYYNGMGSKNYAALCALGEILRPNMALVEEENEAYIALNNLAKE